MKIKKYEVYDMREAIELIKKDLGPDAVILSTKKVVKNGSFGLFSRPIIEVTAAVDYDLEEKSDKKKLSVDKQDKNKDFDIEELINRLGLDKFELVLKEIGEIKKQISEIKNHNKTEIRGVDLPDHLSPIYNVMVKNGVDDILVYKFLKKIAKRISVDFSKSQIKKIVIQLLGDLIPVEKNYLTSLKQKIIAMVGPTGVGKTTTIAKIAANLSLKYQSRVALITIDTFRIGAVEQLKTYAEIVNIPLKVASTPQELKSHIEELKGFEYVFIDSMGRSQYDDTQINEMANFLDVNPLITTVLVLSMSSNHVEMYDTFDRYKILHPEYLIFTKLDETRHFGPLLNVPVIKKVPLLLLSTGQNVPEDLEIPDGKKIAIKLLSEIQRMWRE